jgi:hypothetical protein
MKIGKGVKDKKVNMDSNKVKECNEMRIKNRKDNISMLHVQDNKVIKDIRNIIYIQGKKSKNDIVNNRITSFFGG